jgi:transposase
MIMNRETKKEIVRLHLEEGRTLKSLADEYGICKATVSNWIKDYREECRLNTDTAQENDMMRENLRLRTELAEAQKEVAFLKKAAAFFAKEVK